MRARTLAPLIALAGLTLLSGCFSVVPDPAVSARDAQFMAMTPQPEIDPHFARYKIRDATGEAPGTVVVDTKARQLYLVLPNREAIRYGVTVGDEAFGWSGASTVARKAEWPDWTPPAEMKKRWPHVAYTKGGPNSPLGARALYLYEGGRDTLYRIHGTNEPEKIGLAVSSGCIRMRNMDAVDLYNRVPVGTRVVVR